MKIAVLRLTLLGLTSLMVASCEIGEAAEDAPTILTVEAARGNLLIRAEATGTVEPVREVEVKSKASGEILRLHVDVGDEVERGTLLAEIDPRDVRNRFNQVQADLGVAEARIEISTAQLERSTRLLEAEVITQQEHENATLDYANAQANLVRATTDFELAELQLADVRIRAPMAGTIIQKNIEEGAVIQSASSNVSGGTALFVMANLGEMQVRALVDETDMGQLQPGMQTDVRVEAFPDRTFQGLVEKIEPQAQVEQNVTMFPVIVSLANRSGLLKPGMNAEVEVFIDEAIDIVMVPNNAIVQTSDVGPAAMALGLDVDALDLTQFSRPTRGGGFAGTGRGGSDGGRPTARDRGGQSTDRAGQGRRGRGAGGEVNPDSMRVAMRALAGQDRGQRGSERGGFGSGFGTGDAGAAPPRETRPAAVFVMGADSLPEPRLVQLGLGDWDNTQVVSGLEAGETLVIVGVAQLQAQQQEFLEWMRSRMGGSPFGGGAAGRGGGRGR